MREIPHGTGTQPGQVQLPHEEQTLVLRVRHVRAVRCQLQESA